MVWMQMALFGLVSGFGLFGINRIKAARAKWLWHLVFLITASLVASSLVGAQQIPDDDAQSVLKNIGSSRN